MPIVRLAHPYFAIDWYRARFLQWSACRHSNPLVCIHMRPVLIPATGTQTTATLLGLAAVSSLTSVLLPSGVTRDRWRKTTAGLVRSDVGSLTAALPLLGSLHQLQASGSHYCGASSSLQHSKSALQREGIPQRLLRSECRSPAQPESNAECINVLKLIDQVHLNQPCVHDTVEVS